jgi:hypothetical protein
LDHSIGEERAQLSPILRGWQHCPESGQVLRESHGHDANTCPNFFGSYGSGRGKGA